MRLVLLGPPGCGKGTQGRRLAERLGIPHISTGEMIRQEIAARTEFGLQVEAAIAAGNFAPDDSVLRQVDRRLHQDDARQGYLLDGFPRDFAQAVAFDALLAARRERLDAVIDLQSAEGVLIARLSGRLVCPSCGAAYHRVSRPPRREDVCDDDGAFLTHRPDDCPASIRQRLRVYAEKTAPLQAYYAAQGILKTVSAEETPEIVEKQILQSLGAASEADSEV